MEYHINKVKVINTEINAELMVWKVLIDHVNLILILILIKIFANQFDGNISNEICCIDKPT
jgi:hypothetical protein